MAFSIHLREPQSGRWLGARALGCLVLAISGRATLAQTPATQGSVVAAQTQSGQRSGVASAVATAGAQPLGRKLDKKTLRKAEDAYLAGAKKLKKNDLDGAENEFLRAQRLDPGNPDYAQALVVTRQHRVKDFVPNAAETRAAARSGDGAGNSGAESLADRAGMLAGSEGHEPWRIQVPALAGAVQLAPTDAVRSFHLRGVSPDVFRNVAAAYGIRAVIDDSVERKNLRFDLEGVRYEQAMSILMQMTNSFTVPVDENSVIVAKSSKENRDRLERQLEETIYLPGATAEQIKDLVSVARSVFDVQHATVQNSPESIVVRAPEAVLAPMNRTLQDLMDSDGEVMVEVKMYEVDTTRTNNAGASIPTAAGVYNVEQAATSLVNANQTLVQEAISQGLVSATASNIVIAGELIASGLVTSSLLSSTVGVVGGGTTMTGITETGSIGFNLGLNVTDTRTLEDVQMRVGDRQEATFREGSKYPIATSTYSTGSTTSASPALSNATINGVSVASLLSQYTGGSGATIPQVTYEDLGVTLNATPMILKAGLISMKLDLKIEALSGNTSDGNPILESRQFASDISMREGESVLMVSNVTRSETAAMTGIPGLSELPGFQAPIADDTEKNTNQLVLVVTPHVVRRRSDLLAGPRIMLHAQMAAD